MKSWFSRYSSRPTFISLIAKMAAVETIHVLMEGLVKRPATRSVSLVIADCGLRATGKLYETGKSMHNQTANSLIVIWILPLHLSLWEYVDLLITKETSVYIEYIWNTLQGLWI